MPIPKTIIHVITNLQQGEKVSFEATESPEGLKITVEKSGRTPVTEQIPIDVVRRKKPGRFVGGEVTKLLDKLRIESLPT